MFKFHPKIETLSLFSHLNSVLYSFGEIQKRRCYAECSRCSFTYNESEC